MTHDEVQGRLVAYAAGTLVAAEADAVRAHLAAGCLSCLESLYRLPVGLPRRRLARGTRLGLIAAIVAGTLVPTVAVLYQALRASRAAVAEEAAAVERERGRAARAEATSGALATRLAERDAALARLRQDLSEAEQRAMASDAERDRAAAEAAAAVAERERLATALRRQRSRSPVRTAARGGEASGLGRRLLAGPGLHVLPLAPVGRYRDARGHLLWRSGVDEALLFVFGLPDLGRGESYHADVRHAGGRVRVPIEAPGGQPDAGIPIRMGGAIEGIAVVRDATGEHVLASGP